jgi:hypothetical protein
MPSINRRANRVVRSYQSHSKTDRSIYDSYRWKQLRKHMKAARRLQCWAEYGIDQPLCEIGCRDKDDDTIIYEYSIGLIEVATICDHIRPVNQGGDPWSMSNIQVIGHRAHQRKSQQERFVK